MYVYVYEVGVTYEYIHHRTLETYRLWYEIYKYVCLK